MRGQKSSKTGALRIGTSGWVYKHWSGKFYPEDLDSADYLSFYSKTFDTAELNYSFYKLPSPENYRAWAEEVPANFIFSVKASRYLTHMKKLKDPAEPWQRICETAGCLGDKLGPILLQFPERWKQNASRLEEFLELANAQHDPIPKLRLAFEFRDESWFDKKIYTLLEKYNAALCIADSLKFIRKDIITADFTYIRYHGRKPIYAANYTATELRTESKKIAKWLSSGTDVYAYFNNDGEGHALKNSQSLLQLLAP